MVECHKKNEYVLLAVYVTGHGYMSDREEKNSQILLNQRIHFNRTLEADKKFTTFFNPYPVEKMLSEMYKMF